MSNLSTTIKNIIHSKTSDSALRGRPARSAYFETILGELPQIVQELANGLSAEVAGSDPIIEHLVKYFVFDRAYKDLAPALHSQMTFFGGMAAESGDRYAESRDPWASIFNEGAFKLYRSAVGDTMIELNKKRKSFSDKHIDLLSFVKFSPVFSIAGHLQALTALQMDIRASKKSIFTGTLSDEDTRSISTSLDLLIEYLTGFGDNGGSVSTLELISALATSEENLKANDVKHEMRLQFPVLLVSSIESESFLSLPFPNTTAANLLTGSVLERFQSSKALAIDPIVMASTPIATMFWLNVFSEVGNDEKIVHRALFKQKNLNSLLLPFKLHPLSEVCSDVFKENTDAFIPSGKIETFEFFKTMIAKDTTIGSRYIDRVEFDRVLETAIRLDIVSVADEVLRHFSKIDISAGVRDSVNKYMTKIEVVETEALVIDKAASLRVIELAGTAPTDKQITTVNATSDFLQFDKRVGTTKGFEEAILTTLGTSAGQIEKSINFISALPMLSEIQRRSDVNYVDVFSKKTDLQSVMSEILSDLAVGKLNLTAMTTKSSSLMASEIIAGLKASVDRDAVIVNVDTFSNLIHFGPYRNELEVKGMRVSTRNDNYTFRQISGRMVNPMSKSLTGFCHILLTQLIGGYAVKPVARLTDELRHELSYENDRAIERIVKYSSVFKPVKISSSTSRALSNPYVARLINNDDLANLVRELQFTNILVHDSMTATIVSYADTMATSVVRDASMDAMKRFVNILSGDLEKDTVVEHLKRNDAIMMTSLMTTILTPIQNADPLLKLIVLQATIAALITRSGEGGTNFNGFSETSKNIMLTWANISKK